MDLTLVKSASFAQSELQYYTPYVDRDVRLLVSGKAVGN